MIHIRYSKYIIIVIFIIIIIYFYSTSTEKFITTTESIANIASMYNSDTITATKLRVSSGNFNVDASGLRLGNNFSVDASGLRLGDNFRVDLSGNINGKNSNMNSSFLLTINIGTDVCMPICDARGNQFYSNKYTCIISYNSGLTHTGIFGYPSQSVFVSNGKWWVENKDKTIIGGMGNNIRKVDMVLLFLPIPFISYLNPGSELSPLPQRMSDNFTTFVTDTNLMTPLGAWPTTASVMETLGKNNVGTNPNNNSYKVWINAINNSDYTVYPSPCPLS